MRLAMAALSLLPGAAVAQLPLAPRAPLVLDVRTQDEWDAGHISCAKRMPVQDDSSLIQAVKLLVGLDLTVPLVTYCHSGVRAGKAEEALKASGFTYVRNGGGYDIPPSNTAQLEQLCTPPTVPKVTIAPGVEMPMIVMGTGSGQKGDVVNATTLWLSRAGGTGIDTAHSYRDQDEIAQGLAATGALAQRSALFLETKIPCSKTYAEATANLNANLQQLGVASVDLTLIHFPCSGKDASAGNAQTWRAMEDFHSAGKSKAIGVSNFDAGQLRTLATTSRVTPALNQCKLSVVHHDQPTIDYCRTAGITYQSYSPLCGGFNGSSCSRSGGENVMTRPDVLAIADSHGVSAAQIGLKWIVQKGFPLTTAVWDLKYMRQDLDLWSWGNLTEPEMTTLSAIANAAVCQAELQRVCGRAKKSSKGNCFICTGQHQQAMMQAHCAQADFTSFCSA